MPVLPPAKAFVVEDEPLVLETLRRSLETIGVEVKVVATCARKGIALAKTVEADIALLDVFLDGDYSFPIAEILDRRGIPYIYVTGHTLQIDLNGHYLAISVEKPVRTEDLKAAIERSISRHEARPLVPPGSIRRWWHRLRL